MHNFKHSLFLLSGMLGLFIYNQPQTNENTSTEISLETTLTDSLRSSLSCPSTTAGDYMQILEDQSSDSVFFSGCGGSL